MDMTNKTKKIILSWTEKKRFKLLVELFNSFTNEKCPYSYCDVEDSGKEINGQVCNDCWLSYMESIIERKKRKSLDNSTIMQSDVIVINTNIKVIQD